MMQGTQFELKVAKTISSIELNPSNNLRSKGIFYRFTFYNYKSENAYICHIKYNLV